jgi:hypothetical protein
VLDVLDDGGLMRVTAEVSVRVEDFKRYIKTGVLAEKKVRKGLLSKIKIKKKQNSSIVDLVVNKVLKDLSTYQVVTPIINGEIEEVTDLDILTRVGVGNKGYVIKIPIKSTINPEFLENITRILDETAKNKYSKRNINSIGRFKRGYSITIGDFEYKPRRGEGGRKERFPGKSLYKLTQYGSNLFGSEGTSLYSRNSNQFQTYVFPERVGFDLCAATKKLENNFYFKLVAPDIKVSFIGENGESLKELYLTNTGDGSISPRFMSNDEITVSSVGGDKDVIHLYTGFDSPSKRNKFRCNVIINTSTEYLLVTSVSEEVLSGTSKVTVQYIPSLPINADLITY